MSSLGELPHCTHSVTKPLKLTLLIYGLVHFRTTGDREGLGLGSGLQLGEGRVRVGVAGKARSHVVRKWSTPIYSRVLPLIRCQLPALD